MPGIISYAADERPEQLRANLERMVQLYRRNNGMRADLHAGERAGLASVGPDQGAPLLARQRGVWLAFYGLIVQEEELRRVLEPGAGFEPTSTADLLLELFLAYGRDALCDLNGGYALAVWEEAPRRLTVINDRSGYRPVYYREAAGQVIVASEYKAISAVSGMSKTVDPAAVADLFHFRAPMTGRTLFQEIRAMPPAGLLVCEDGRVQVSTYWKPRFFSPDSRLKSETEYADELAGLLRQAVRRRVREGTTLLITGGLDSRAVAGFFRKEAPGVPLTTTTIGKPGGEDAVIGSRVARRLGLPHVQIPLDDHYLVDYAARAAWVGEGRLEAYASWIIAQADFMRENNFRYALTGLYGNLVSGRSVPHGVLAARTFEQALQAVGSIPEREHQLLARLMRPELFATAGKESYHAFRDFYSTVDAPDLLSRYDMIRVNFPLARHANTADALGDVALFLEPFLDIDVLDFTFSGIPVQVRNQANFYYRMFLRHLPEVAGVRVGGTSFGLPAHMLLNRRPALRLLDDYRRRGLRRLFPNRFGEAISCVPHAGAICGGSRGYVQEILSREEYLADIFDMHAVQTMLDEHISGKANAFQPISALLTFALWREQFCDRDGPLPVGEMVQTMRV